ncbi:pectate lyase superfamily protein-domain-containing protein [Ustulina deusta]|nr:pectate lyase superfamily protein-domain-containing protein [Ustulina deusta]
MASLIRQDVNNYFGTAPDRGSLNGPIPGLLNASALARIHGATETRQDDGYWLASLGSFGQSPFAPSGYQFFRNVRDFGAVGDGVTDDTAAINRAAATFSASDTSTLRCADDCGSITTLGAVVYFPPGTYLISTPIIQYYYTQFVSNPNNRAIPGGNGDEWYINQSNFYRQIRNLEFDMTRMNWTNFMMAVSDGAQRATAVGIYMENGSGGGVSDLTFFGGDITSLLTAIYHVWNWGFV